MMAANGTATARSGFVLRNSYTRNGELRRTLYNGNNSLRVTNKRYVPPVFLLVYYDVYLSSDQRLRDAAGVEPHERARTDAEDTCTMMMENTAMITALLAQHQPFNMNVSMLRLEAARNAQYDDFEEFPLPYTSIGALTKISFDNVTRRNAALDTLWNNRLANQCVYSVSRSANTSLSVICDCLEPLFSYVEKLNRPYGPHDIAALAYNDRAGAPRRRAMGQRLGQSNIAADNYDDMFDIDIHVFDNRENDDDAAVGAVSSAAKASVHGDAVSSALSTGSVDSVGRRGRTAAAPTPAPVTRPSNTNNVLRERPWSSGGADDDPFNGHAVNSFFAIVEKQNLTKMYAAQLSALPVLVVQMNDEYCGLTCSTELVMNTGGAGGTETSDGNRSVLLTVYYAWTSRMADALLAVSDRVRRSSPDERVAVEKFDNATDAKVRMLRDFRVCIWKDNSTVCVRLALSARNEERAYARHIFEPMWADSVESALKLQIEVNACKVANESFDPFYNSITIDCTKAAAALGTRNSPDNSRFVDAFHALNNSYTGYINSDLSPPDASDSGAYDERTVHHVLWRRHTVHTELVDAFRARGILAKLCDVCRELGVGLLDAFGANCWDHEPTGALQSHFVTNDREAAYNAQLFDNERKTFASLVETSVFVDMLRNHSLYYASNSNANYMKCARFKATAAAASPFTGYRHTDPAAYDYVYDVDLNSSYPSVCRMFNVSPECTAILTRERFDELARRYGDTFQEMVYHTSHTDTGNYVVVSIRERFYAGALGRFMAAAIERRRAARDTEMRFFYKRIASIVYGCALQPSSDLYAPQCAYAVISTVSAVIAKVMRNVAQETLFVKTDGALIVSRVDSADDMRTHMDQAIETFMDDHGVYSAMATGRDDRDDRRFGHGGVHHQNQYRRQPLTARVRAVHDCAVIDRDTYLMRLASSKAAATVVFADGGLSRREYRGLTDAALRGVYGYLLQTMAAATAGAGPGGGIDTQAVISCLTTQMGGNAGSLLANTMDVYDLYVDATVASVLERKCHVIDRHFDMGRTLAAWKCILVDGVLRRRETRVRLPMFEAGICTPDTTSLVYELTQRWIYMFCEQYDPDFKAGTFRDEFGRAAVRISYTIGTCISARIK